MQVAKSVLNFNSQRQSQHQPTQRLMRHSVTYTGCLMYSYDHGWYGHGLLYSDADMMLAASSLRPKAGSARAAQPLRRRWKKAKRSCQASHRPLSSSAWA